MKNNQYFLNDILIMKKAHACGSNEWKLIRTGMDYKLECLNCKRQIMMTKIDFLKRVKKKKEK